MVPGPEAAPPAAPPDLVVAVDWSGRQDSAGQRRHIRAAEVSGDELVSVSGGRTREEVAAHLEVLAAVHARLAVGLDFSFSFPAWFLAARGWEDGPAAWSAAETEGEGWLAGCTAPFWGHPGRRAPPADPRRPAFRTTEADVRATTGARPSSTFQIGGAGAVGTASVRGMPVLARLRARGFRVWPFDAPGWPLVVEIYPRLLTGPVRKSDPEARRGHMARHFCQVDPGLANLSTASEDAFDAAVSALVMAAHGPELAALPHLGDRVSTTEGRIWRPRARA